MPNYRDMYFQLAAKVADAIELLTKAQRQGEDQFIGSVDAVLTLLPKEDEKSAPPDCK